MRSPVLSEIQNKIHILEDMQKLGVLLRALQLNTVDKHELLWMCISNSSNNYRQVCGCAGDYCKNLVSVLAMISDKPWTLLEATF